MSNEIKWYHFWNPQSGAIGGLIFFGLVLLPIAWFIIWLIFEVIL